MSPYTKPPPEQVTPVDRQGLEWDARENGYSLLPFVVHEPLEWREKGEEDGKGEDEGYELHIPTQDRWRTIREHWIPVLEALAAGETLPEVHERAAEAIPERPDKQIRFIIRRVTGKLKKWDMAEIVIPEAPAVFDGRYERLEELGRGGMGVVWLCRDLDAQEQPKVAVKHAWNWRGSLKRRQRSLKDEAAVMADADHPGIIAHLDEFELDGRFHLVREFLKGPSLSSWAREKPLGLDERVRLLEEIIDGLVHLREIGYLCLDVKTSNYMLDGPGQAVKLADLGLCKELEDGRVELSAFAGTLSYQDPHLRKEGYADERSTVYSVGRVLYVLVTGRGLRARANYDSYYQQHEVDVAKLEATHATPEETALFRDACSPWPQDRPETLEAFRDRLP